MIIPLEPVRIQPQLVTIPVPYEMTITEAWTRIWYANRDGVEPWPPDILIRNYIQLLVHPSGRILGVAV